MINVDLSCRQLLLTSVFVSLCLRVCVGMVELLQIVSNRLRR